VRTNRTIAESCKTEPPNLVKVACRPTGDQSYRPERLIGGTHHLAKGGGYGRVIEILEYHNRRAGQFRKSLHLILQ
jgi:hypothetical protein